MGAVFAAVRPRAILGRAARAILGGGARAISLTATILERAFSLLPFPAPPSLPSTLCRRAAARHLQHNRQLVFTVVFTAVVRAAWRSQLNQGGGVTAGLKKVKKGEGIADRHAPSLKWACTHPNMAMYPP
eukprot:6263300-Prymnesium_polylepis.2